MNDPGPNPLLLGLAAGDQQAFAVLYDRFAVRLYRAAFGMLGCREDAEDVMQEVFLATVRCRERLIDVRDLNAYLFTALRRAAGRAALRRPRMPQASATALDAVVTPVVRTAVDDPQWGRLQQALRALPKEQREVIALKIDGELTFAQMAQVLGVSVNTAASRYRYALQKLRNSMVGKRTLVEGKP